MFRKAMIAASIFSMQLWLGASVFLSFILAPILFKTFGVDIAADVMGAVFPFYGALLVFCSGLGFLGLSLQWDRRAAFGEKIFFIAWVSLGMDFLLNLAQSLYLFPRSHELRLLVKQARSNGNIDDIAPQAEEMMRLHGLSTSINAFSVLLAIFSVWIFYNLAREWDKARI